MYVMKKIFIVLFLLLICCIPVLAYDDSAGAGIDSIQNNQKLNDTFSRQKPVTDEEFQKALEFLKQKKGIKTKKFKGQYMNDENSGEYIKDTADKNIILTLPITLINNDGNEIPIGHYKVVGEKTNGKVYLDFYQTYTCVAKVPAKETDDDFNEQNINFVKIVPYNDKQVKVIFGSMDFNAYTFINIKPENLNTNQ